MKQFVILFVLSISLQTMATSTEDLSLRSSVAQLLPSPLPLNETLPISFNKINISIKKKFDINDYSSEFWRGNKKLINRISKSEYHVNTLGNMELFFINDDIFIETNHIEYRFGGFSVETGFTVANMDDIKGKGIYSKGSLVILSNYNFNLTVTAQVGIFDETLSYDFYQPSNPESYHIGKSTFSSLGITGSYKVNRQWQVMGAVSATHVSESQQQRLRALTGTVRTRDD
jgi:hypothetical protein